MSVFSFCNKKEEVKTKAPVVSAAFSLTGKYVVLVHGGKGIQISKQFNAPKDYH